MEYLKITKEIETLDLKNIKENLFKYSYRTKNLQNFDFDQLCDDIPPPVAYSSFKGEVYENIMYEFLLYYALDEPLITRFVLKGPHQNFNNKLVIKSGMAINKHDQIVYKASYKDITEYDALFFTKDSVYFVEMSIAKKTSSLNKRLDKKHALLKILFPSLKIKALVILTKGSFGVTKFPPYSTIWITKDFEDNEILKELIYKKQSKTKISAFSSKKFVQVTSLKYNKFIYFQTLQWVLLKSRSNQNCIVDINFLKSKKVQLYFNIFTKFYIGFITIEEIKKIMPMLENIPRDGRVFVTCEKINRTSYDIVYYIKEKSGKLNRISFKEGILTIKEKDPYGFTNVEVRFISRVLSAEHELNYKQIIELQKNILRLGS